MTHRDTTELREKIASIQHEQWSGWMKYMFSKCTKNLDGTYTIPEWAVFRWYNQIMTPYEKLTDKEQESDRIEADKLLALLSSELSKKDEAFAQYKRKLLEEIREKEVVGIAMNDAPAGYDVVVSSTPETTAYNKALADVISIIKGE